MKRAIEYMSTRAFEHIEHSENGPETDGVGWIVGGEAGTP